jgi:hypothetical protein
MSLDDVIIRPASQDLFRSLRVRITYGRKLRATKVGHYTQIHMKFHYDHQFVQKLFGGGRGVPNGLDDTRNRMPVIVKFLKAV